MEVSLGKENARALMFGCLDRALALMAIRKQSLVRRGSILRTGHKTSLSSKAIEYLQLLVYGVVWFYSRLVAVLAVLAILGSILYCVVYLPLAWAINHIISIFDMQVS